MCVGGDGVGGRGGNGRFYVFNFFPHIKNFQIKKN